jgi:predicted RNA-binding Zn ribbon-like protein
MLDKISAGNILVKADIDLINNYMIGTSFYRQLQSEEGCYRLYDIPEAHIWSWFMAEVAASLSRLCSSDAVKSLRICQNPKCGWFFVDESKSKNRKWCDDTCATLMKVRRFRQKQKENDKFQNN